ncbi:Fic family protein [Campylobacter devanensis]|uniref:Fic family protein n=1 Tax=Campylobacter devanensis TaxID=3161138 RepID=UPI000A333F5E|nr:Fic family protein [Campylobacter sp. P0136]
MLYNPNFLNNSVILSDNQKEELESLANEFSLNDFINNARLIDKISFDFIYSSAQIEGNTYTKADTLALIEDGITANGKKYTDAKMIINLRNSFNEIMRNSMEVNLNTIYFLHSIISQDLVLKQNEGAMRNGNLTGITGSSYIPLSSGERLREELNFLFSQYKNLTNPFERAIYLHNNLCYLQYFEDCNKRTARVMQFISLKNDNIMPLVIIDSKKEDYSLYRLAMIDYYETGDYTKYIEFFINIYKRQMKYLDEINSLNNECTHKQTRKQK